MKYQKGTFTIVPNIQSLDKIDVISQALFLWICKYADDDGTCYPSRAKLARHIGRDARTVDRHMVVLEENGYITKTKRLKAGTKENMSNLYQIELLSPPSDTDVATPTVTSVPVTISNTNYTHITISDTNVSEAEVIDLPKQEEVKPIVVGQLPDKFGKNYIDRIIFVYRTLWGAKFNTPYQITSFGKIGKMIKTLVSNNTEYQVALLLLTHFNWRGATGTDDKEYMFLSSKGFPLELLPNKINIYIAYLTNVIGLDYNNEDSVKEYVVKNLKPLIK